MPKTVAYDYGFWDHVPLDYEHKPLILGHKTLPMTVTYDCGNYFPFWLWILPMTMDICLWLWTQAFDLDIKYYLWHNNGDLNTYDSWLGKLLLRFCDYEIGSKTRFIYSVCSWFSLVLDCGNLPIKLGLPMFSNLFCLFLVLDRGNLPIKLGLPIFLNLRRYPNLLCQLLSLFIASLVHSLFSTNLDLFTI